MINCIIIDDEQHVIELLTSHLEKIKYINILNTFNKPLDALSFIYENQVDLIFIDIEMPELSGMDIINIVKGDIDIIIISAFTEYAVEAFNNDVIDYLLKPISFKRLLHALQKIEKRNSAIEKTTAANLSNYILLKTDSKTKLAKIELAEIIFVEGLKNYVSIFTTSQRIISLLNIKTLTDQLPGDKFVRIHKSYIISIQDIKYIDGNNIHLKSRNEIIPIGESYKSYFFDLIKPNLIENKKIDIL